MNPSCSHLRQYLLSRTASLIFVAVTGFVIPPNASAQTTLVVDDDGQGTAADCNAGAPAFNSIQTAVNAAAPGDTIFICPGTYDEQVVVTTSDLTIQGAGASLTILQPSAVSPSTNDLNFGVPMRPILLVDHAARVAVSDLTIDGSIADGGSRGVAICEFPSIGAYVGIYYRNGSGQVEATHVSHMRSATVCTRGFVSESDLAGTSSVVLHGNVFDNYGEVGISCVRPNTTCEVTGNTVRGRGPVNDEIQAGITVRAGAAATISGNVITDHYFLPRSLEGPMGGVSAIAVGVFLVAVDPSTHPHILRDNSFANNELNVQRID